MQLYPNLVLVTRRFLFIVFLFLLVIESRANSEQAAMQGVGIYIDSHDRFFIATSLTPGQADVIAEGTLVFDQSSHTVVSLAEPKDHALEEGRFWKIVAIDPHHTNQMLRTVFELLKSKIDQNNTVVECVIAASLQLSIPQRKLISSILEMVFGCAEGGARTIHEVYAGAAGMNIQPADIEEHSAVIVLPDGMTYLLGEDEATLTLLDTYPPPFSPQYVLRHGTPQVVAFLQNDRTNQSLSGIPDLGDIPTQLDHLSVVARGAAILASYLLPQEPVSLLPLSLSVVLQGSYAYIIVRRFSLLPQNSDVLLTTVHDNQQTVTIEIREGSRPRAIDNLPLAQLVLNNIPPAPSGMLQIQLSVVIDKYHSNIEIEAVETKSGVRAKHVVERGVILYKDGVLEAQQAAEEKYRLQDEALRDGFNWAAEGRKHSDAVQLFENTKKHDEL